MTGGDACDTDIQKHQHQAREAIQLVNTRGGSNRKLIMMAARLKECRAAIFQSLAEPGITEGESFCMKDGVAVRERYCSLTIARVA
jgi:hypothetical protein